MRNKKLITALFVCIAVLILVLVYRGMGGKEKSPDGNFVTTGQAARAVALLVATRDDCESAAGHFSKNEEWYVPYMNLLYEREYFTEKQFIPSKKEAESVFTYKKLENLYENMGITDKKLLSFVKNNKSSQGITNEKWAEVVSAMAEKLAGDSTKEIDLTVIASQTNVTSMEKWTAVTSAGNYKFTGLELDYYMDKHIKALVKSDEILCVTELVSSNITYPNVLVTSVQSGQLNVFINGIVRTFEVDDKDLSATNAIADLSLKSGKVTDYKIKQGYVSGKLLKYTDHMVEIEGQGSYEIADGFRAYKTYGNIESKTLYDMVVGYDVQKFLIEDGKLCAVLIDRNFVAQNIRVVLKTNGFQDIYHDSVRITSAGEYQFTYGTETKKFTAGEEFTITQDSKYLEAGSLTIRPMTADEKITLASLERGYGSPSYRGSIEVIKTEHGLVLVNELPLEQYLYAVVPSEMPYTYQTEALKAQAVCARTYAYKHMVSNDYAWLGAHVDDSTAYQVYNNSEEQTTTSQAVDDTYGQIMTCNGGPISAFFYSTSCGSSTDATIWGGSGYEYIRGKLLSQENPSLDLKDESQFRMFITNNYDTWDKNYAWYRWNVTMPLAEISQGVNQIIGSLYSSGPEKVLTLEGGQYVSREISSVGNVQSVETGTRNTGGVLDYVIIHGDAATVMVRTESYIRKIFNPYGLDINKNDGSTVNTFTGLPSAFFVLDEVRDGDNNLTGYLIQGGGYGHGAGMSQNGANTMAGDGYSCQDILQFFYTNINIENLY